MNDVKKKILIVDDEQDLADALVAVLGNEGFETYKATGGEEGIALAEKYKPDLVLLDISMPQINGIEVLKTYRASEWGKEMPVVVMTALDDLAKVAEVMEAGGDEYVVKSQITLDEMVKKVRSKLHMA